MEDLLRILAQGTKREISTRALLNEELKDRMGIETVFAAVRYFHFPKEIDDNIRAKVLQVQEFELNTSLTNLRSAEAQLADVEEHGKQAMDNLGADGQAYFDRRTGDKDKYVRITNSNGNKLLDLAKAYRDQKERNVLEIPGSANWVNLQLADLSFQKTGLLMMTPETFKAYLASWGK